MRLLRPRQARHLSSGAVPRLLAECMTAGLHHDTGPLRGGFSSAPPARPPGARRAAHGGRPGHAVAAAAARSSPRHALHPVVYHPDFQISPLPEAHRFPMPKASRLDTSPAWTQDDPPGSGFGFGFGLTMPVCCLWRCMQDHLLYLRLQELGMATAENTFQPAYPDEETLRLCHDEAYVRGFLSGTIAPEEMRKINLPWSEKLVRRTLVGTGSAITAARMALQAGVACMCNGGTHHAHRAHGSGWCIFNDQAVAARLMQQEGAVGQVLFIDLDVHQGDGTAAIFANDPTVFTFSLHCHDQPFPAVRPPSDLDIGLAAGTGDEEYLEVVHETVPKLLDEVGPDIVFYNAGVDPHKDDRLGLLSLSDCGISERDQAVISACASRGIPVAAAIGGGYAEDHLSIVERHVSLHQAAQDTMAEHGPWGRVKLRRRNDPQQSAVVS